MVIIILFANRGNHDTSDDNSNSNNNNSSSSSSCSSSTTTTSTKHTHSNNMIIMIMIMIIMCLVPVRTLVFRDHQAGVFASLPNIFQVTRKPLFPKPLLREGFPSGIIR